MPTPQVFPRRQHSENPGILLKMQMFLDCVAIYIRSESNEGFKLLRQKITCFQIPGTRIVGNEAILLSMQWKC